MVGPCHGVAQVKTGDEALVGRSQPSVGLLKPEGIPGASACAGGVGFPAGGGTGVAPGGHSPRYAQQVTAGLALACHLSAWWALKLPKGRVF